jgi:hypothetical protein
LDGNLNPILEHPTICSVGFSDKRHYNKKSDDVKQGLKEKHDKLVLKEIVEVNRRNFAWPTA